MRLWLIGLFLVLASGCGINEVNSRGYIISQSETEEIPLDEEIDISQ